MPANPRRDFLSKAYNGIGAMALGGMLAYEARSAANPSTPKTPHLRRKAKNLLVFLLFLTADGPIVHCPLQVLLSTVASRPSLLLLLWQIHHVSDESTIDSHSCGDSHKNENG